MSTIQVCSNCEKQLPSDRFDLHLGYCRRNIKRCGDCNRPYDVNSLEEHREEFHQQAECQYCRTKVPANLIASHKNSCEYKPVQCVYCQVSVPTQRFEEHKLHCQSRTKPCDKCEKPITNKDYLDHVSKCTGKSIQTSSQNLNSYSPPESSQSQTTRTYVSNSYSYPTQSYSSSNYSTDVNCSTSPVIRTYVRTYNGTSDLPISQYSQPTPSSATGTSSASSSQSYTSYNYSDGTYPAQARVISRRVISTRVVPPEQYSKYPDLLTNTTTYVNASSYTPSTTTYSGTVSSPNATYSYTPSQVTSSSGSYSTPARVHTRRQYAEEDPELQAALYASLGYAEETSPQLYQMIQTQHQIQKQFKKS